MGTRLISMLILHDLLAIHSPISELAGRYRISARTVSRHLADVKEAGFKLIKVNHHGIYFYHAEL